MPLQPQVPDPLPALPPLRAVCFAGRDEVLALGTLLEDVAGRLGHDGAMHWLRYFVDHESARARTPVLVLLLHRDAPLPDTPRLPAAEDVFGCGLFSEYVVCGVRTGAMATEDTSGFRTVLAPGPLRGAAAARCAAELVLQRRAHAVLATYCGTAPHLPADDTMRWGIRERMVGSHLDLQPTLAATLATFNRTVRFRLGYFRRRLLQTTPCRLVPDAFGELTAGELLALNRASLNPVSDAEVLLRWQATQSPGSYTLGLRTEDGQWLGIIGGWRQGNTTVLQWQLNSAGWEKHSLSTVLRSYFLEHETARGTRNIVFYGGTPHGIRHYFVPVAVTDLLLLRRSLQARLLMLLARVYSSALVRVRRPNFLAEALTSADTRWL